MELSWPRGEREREKIVIHLPRRLLALNNLTLGVRITFLLLLPFFYCFCYYFQRVLTVRVQFGEFNNTMGILFYPFAI